MRLKLIAALICILFTTSSAAVIWLRPPPPPAGGQTNTLFDDYSTDTTGTYDAMGTTCTHDATNSEMEWDGSGACKVKVSSATSPPGDQPSSPDMWILYRQGTSTQSQWSGPAIRMNDAADPGEDDQYYIVTCDQQSDIRLWNCDNIGAPPGSAECETIMFEEVGDTCNRQNDVIAIAVANADIDTEICYWIWDGGVDSPTITDSIVPDDFTNASTFRCFSSDGTFDDPKITGITGFSGAIKTTWTVAPDNHINSEYANDGTNCAAHSSSGTIDEVTAMACGNL